MDSLHDKDVESIKESEALRIMKEVVGVVDMDEIKALHDNNKIETPDAKRHKIDSNISLKEASLNALADVTTQNTGTAQSVVGLAPSFSFPYASYGLGYLHPFPQATMLDSEQYQLLMQQQQFRYLEGMRELQTRTQQEEETVTPKKSRTKTPSSSLSASLTNSQYTGRFVLLEQPNVRQRKSYKNENRYVLPNPLTICAREEGPGEKLPRVIDGVVTVSLVGAEGQDLPVAKTSILESPEGGLTQTLDSNLSAHFSLKVLDTSEGTMFRLLFTASFTLEGIGSCEEKIMSRPFQVYSNRKKHVKGQEKPSVIDIKPKEGPSAQETEIWIKGRGFSDRVVVSFGDKIGRIVETTENLLTVCAPARFDLVADTPVQVIVSNKYPHELFSADKKFTFVYYVNNGGFNV